MKPRRLDRQGFLACLRDSGLVPGAELTALVRTLPPGSARAAARALVERRVLTRFQAERLLAGRSAGFLIGQYRILEQVGKGGMGRVYKAEHRTMKRLVALKVMAPDLLVTERAVRLFQHEVRAAAQLVHPNIVTAFDAGAAAGRHYLVLEYVDGPNLEELVARQGPLPVGLACDYVRQAADGLQCAHLLGMVHRDVKPANILVQRHGPGGEAPGLVKVSDFGLARLGRATAHPFHAAPGTILARENTVMGTPDYLSPEQSRDLHQVDIRGDLYSLGCTFYFLLTGQVPFPGGTSLEKLIRHGTEAPRPVADLRPGVPAAVLAIVQKLIAKAPEDRFQTPAELSRALQPYAVSGPTPWAPPRPASPLLDPLATGGELSAPGATVAGVLDETAVPLGPPRLPGRRDLRQARRLRLAVLVAVGILGGLVGAAAAVAVLGN